MSESLVTNLSKSALLIILDSTGHSPSAHRAAQPRTAFPQSLKNCWAIVIRPLRGLNCHYLFVQRRGLSLRTRLTRRVETIGHYLPVGAIAFGVDSGKNLAEPKNCGNLPKIRGLNDDCSP